MNAVQRLALADAIRAAIQKSNLSRYEIAKRAGINQAGLSRFMADSTASLRLDTFERLAAVLGVEITLKTRKKPKK